MILERLLDAVDDHLPAAVALRHELHANPELGNEEHDTSRRVAAALSDLVDVEQVLGTGLVARIGPSDRVGVALRAELDGLSLVEETGVPFAATNGRMHACGHDVHLAALVAVCRARMDVGVGRPLVGVFQPSEERYPSGALQLIEAGVLQRHRVGAMLAVHVHPQPRPGAVAIGTGAINASSDEFEIVVEGEPGHAAYPHRTRDPVVALSHVVVALQHLVARRVDPLHGAVVGVGTLRADGAANVVPAEARATGTLRCLEPDDRTALRASLTEVVEHTARAYGCRARVVLTEGEPTLVNDPSLTAHVERMLPATGSGTDGPMRSCGADDFSFYAAELPSVMLFLGVPIDPSSAELHHPHFLPPDDAVRTTARALSAAYAGGAAFLDEVGEPR